MTQFLRFLIGITYKNHGSRNNESAMTTRVVDTDKILIEYLLANGYEKAAAEVMEQQRLRQEQSKPPNVENRIINATMTQISKTSNGNNIQNDNQIVSNWLHANIAANDGASQSNVKNGDRLTTSDTSGNIAATNGGNVHENGISNKFNPKSPDISHFFQDLVVYGVGKGQGQVYAGQYEIIRNWAYESIDLARDELMAICFPIFTHCHLGLLRIKEAALASEFWMKWSGDHQVCYSDELLALAKTISPDLLQSTDFLAQNDFIREALKSKFHVQISEFSYELLASFLMQSDVEVISAIINDKILFQPFRKRPVPSLQVVTLPNYDASSKNGIDSSAALPPISWGVPGTRSLVDSSPMFSSSVDYFTAAMPKTRSDETYSAWINKLIKPKLLLDEPLPSSSSIAKSMSYMDSTGEEVCNPFEPSVILATVMNSYEGMTSMNISTEVTQIVAGFYDSSLRIFRLDEQGKANSKAGEVSSNSQGSKFGKVLLDYGGVSSLSMSAVLPHIPYFTHPTDHTDDEVPITQNGVLDLKGHAGPIYAVDQDLTERLILSGSSDEHVRLWDTGLGQCVGKYSIESPVWDVKFSPIGHYFSTANMDHSLHLYSIDRKSPLRIISGHLKDVNVCRWHDNISLLLSGSADKTARLWDIRAPNSAVRIFRGSNSPITALACSSFGNLVGAGCESGNAQLWEVGTGKSIAILPSEQQSDKSNAQISNPINTMAFAYNSEALCIGSNNCFVRIWDLRSLKSTFHTIGHKKMHTVDELVLKPKNTYKTKFTPVYHVHYTCKNLLVAGGPFSIERATGFTSLDTSLATASEKEAVTALGLSHPIPL